jgi:hypothetical protein
MKILHSLSAWSLALALLLTARAAFGQTVVDGVYYPEITDLGRPQTTRIDSASIPYTAQLPARSTTVAPAELRPTLAPAAGSTFVTSGTTAQTAVAVPTAYGYGFTSVGAPQKVVQVVQPVGYTNTLPQQQVTYVQPVAFNQPTTNLTPLTTLQGSTPFNPYVETKGVPWRPIVNVRSMPDNYVVGQGLIGQPKVYVPSQPVRNFIRYITP